MSQKIPVKMKSIPYGRKRLFCYMDKKIVVQKEEKGKSLIFLIVINKMFAYVAKKFPKDKNSIIDIISQKCYDSIS